MKGSGTTQSWKENPISQHRKDKRAGGSELREYKAETQKWLISAVEQKVLQTTWLSSKELIGYKN